MLIATGAGRVANTRERAQRAGIVLR